MLHPPGFYYVKKPNADHIWLELLVSRVKARDFKASDLAKLS
jgi:hypothetical protein